MNLPLHRFRVIDTETTGPDAEEAYLVELAVTDVEYCNTDQQWKISSTTSRLCKPPTRIPADAMGVHHITDRMVQDKEPADVVINDLLHSTRASDVYVAHSAGYDRRILERHGLLNLTYGKRPWVCTYRLARHIIPNSPNYKNQTLRYYLGLNEQIMLDDVNNRLPTDISMPHRAQFDTIVTANIFCWILNNYKKVETIDDLVSLSESPFLLETIPFGKHKGSKYVDLPLDYLEWMERTNDWGDDVQYTVQKALMTIRRGS